MSLAEGEREYAAKKKVGEFYPLQLKLKYHCDINV